MTPRDDITPEEAEEIRRQAALRRIRELKDELQRIRRGEQLDEEEAS